LLLGQFSQGQAEVIGNRQLGRDTGGKREFPERVRVNKDLSGNVEKVIRQCDEALSI